MWPFFAVAAAVVWTEIVATAAVTAGPSAAAARPAKKTCHDHILHPG